MRKLQIARSHYIICFIISTLVLSSCVFSTSHPTTPTTAGAPTDTGSEIGWFRIYFTDPAAPKAADYEGGPDEILADAIDQARLSVDVAAYNFNLWSIRDALIHAHQRGVVVRMVVESDNMEDREVQQIKDAGIPVIGDQQENLMHNKFVVIDRADVWTGSMNFSVGGAYKDNNNLIHLHSIQAAEDYTTEFEEMFISRLFGQDAFADTPFPKLSIKGETVEVYFSPDDHVADRIVELLVSAHESIYFMAYNFTSDDIGNAIRQQAQAGLNVVGLMDEDQVKSSQGSEYDAFMQAGLNVRVDGNPEGLMHHKVIIIDEKIVITGSYNFTASAEEDNDENVVILFSPAAAETYMGEFWRIHDQTEPP
jgi:phosphatidylserine/phosphatidylglycerophosphate/cardiolipin synthase-like enzyme